MTITAINSLEKYNYDTEYDVEETQDETKNTKDTKNTATDKDKDLMAKGKGAKNEANNSASGVKGLTNQCKDLSGQMNKANQALTADGVKMQQDAKTTYQMLAVMGTQNAKISEENEAVNTELESLTAERESMLAGDKTGVGKASAFSLSVGGADKPQETKGNKNGQFTEFKGEDKTQAPDTSEIDSKIEGLQSKSQGYSEQLGNNFKLTACTMKTYQSKSNYYEHSLKDKYQAAQVAATSAQTTNTIGTVVNTVGVATMAVGAALALGIITAPSAPPVTTSGAGASATGQAATGIAKTLADASAAVSKAIAPVTKFLVTNKKLIEGAALVVGVVELTKSKKTA